MTLYDLYIYGIEEGSMYYPTLKEAQEAVTSLNQAGDLDEGYRLDRITIPELPPRRLACLLLGGVGFVSHREEIEGREPQ